MTETANTEGMGQEVQGDDLGDPVEDPDGDEDGVSITYNPEDPESFNG